MYQPTAAGENVKLLQLLALDYSPRQRFAEANGGTPLHVAAAGNHVLTAHILVQAGGDLNALDDSNETPLMIACSQVKQVDEIFKDHILRKWQGFGSAFFFADPDPDPGGIRGRGLGVKGKMIFFFSFFHVSDDS